MTEQFEVLDDRLTNRVALVTGGSRGIGAATCVALAAKGAAVALHYRGQTEGAQTVSEAMQQRGGEVALFQADLADPSTPDALVRQVVERFGRIDILVNNAGDMTKGAVAVMTDDLWDYTLSVNFSAVFRLCRACLPAMLERGWGRIITVTSQAAYTGSANHSAYSATKAALAGFSYSLAKEVGATGITVNMIAPGRILTDLIRANIRAREEEWMKQTPLRRFGRPEEIAAAVAFLASDAASYITGATLHVNGGMLMS